ncbi:MAG: DUF488 domain-containing protein [Methanobacterium sp.]|jgi:uncharacterized protein (DUF488 family)
MKIYTIGHSNIDFDKFLHLLKKYDIELVVDVRSSPYSKYVPHFNRENLEESLKNSEINYLFLGNRIGGKPKDEKYYKGSKVSYELIETEKPYKEGISQLIAHVNKNRTVILCSEENPYNCHRHHLITQTLLREGLNVNHIRGNGKQEKVEKSKKNDVQATLF